MKKHLFCAVVAIAANADAAQFCVSNEAGLISAMTNAAASAEADEIRFVQGNITINSDLAPARVYGALSLRGGYTVGCTARPSSAGKTTLTAAGRRLHFLLDDHDLLLERMDFVGQSQVSVSGTIANPLVSMILVARTRFLNTGLNIESYSHDVRVENSIFVGGGLQIVGYFTPVTQRSGAISVVNCTSVGAATGISIAQGPVPMPAIRPVPLLLNNISYGNSSQDLRLLTPTLLSHNIYRSLRLEHEGAIAANSQKNLSSNPKLDTSHRPLSGSPAINSGSNDAFPLGPIEKVDDYAGDPRKVGSSIDRGAFEYSNLIFPPVF